MRHSSYTAMDIGHHATKRKRIQTLVLIQVGCDCVIFTMNLCALYRCSRLSKPHQYHPFLSMMSAMTYIIINSPCSMVRHSLECNHSLLYTGSIQSDICVPCSEMHVSCTSKCFHYAWSHRLPGYRASEKVHKVY